MLAIGCLALLEAETLVQAADLVCAMTLDALKGTPRAFDPRIHAARPHPGQMAERAQPAQHSGGQRDPAVAHRRAGGCRTLTRCAARRRCTGRCAIRSREARRVFAIELNSVTDNPLVFGEEILSGGNFHGEPLAFNLDYLAIALTALAGLSERRIDRLVNPALNEDLPPFLTNHAGLESGFMMVQVTAAALVAENRVLATSGVVRDRSLPAGIRKISSAWG